MVVIGLLAIVFIAIQFIPVNRTNPAVTAPIKWNSAETEALARRACMDCHSNETVWPWYANVARPPGCCITMSNRRAAG